MTRKLISLLLSLMLIVSISGIASAEDATAKSVTIQIGADVGSMAPWASDGQGRTAVLYEIYEALFYQRVFGGEALPLLATGYTALGNNVYEITLNEAIYDSEGNHITAEDVVFSYETDIAQGNQASYVGNVVSIKAKDTYTVELELASNGVGIFEDSVCGIRIVSKAAYEKDPMSSVPVGTGPYLLEDWAIGSSITLVKNDHYWNADDRAELAKANVEKITYSIISESSQILIALETGAIDFSSTVAISDIYHFLDGGDQADEFNVASQPAALSQCLFFNCSEGNPFADVRLRQAICYAIDAEGVLEGAYDGLGSICHAFASEKSADYQESWKSLPYYEYDVTKAKELMAEAGYANGFDVRLLCDANASHVMMAQILQMYLADVGINVTISSYDDALFNTYRYDPTQWDLHINNKAGAYVVQQWQYSLDANFFHGSTCNWLVDDTWQQLFETAISGDTHSDETVDAAWMYLREIMPVYGICFSYNYFVSINGMESLYLTDKDVIVPGACTYTAGFGE